MEKKDDTPAGQLKKDAEEKIDPPKKRLDDFTEKLKKQREELGKVTPPPKTKKK